MIGEYKILLLLLSAVFVALALKYYYVKSALAVQKKLNEDLNDKFKEIDALHRLVTNNIAASVVIETPDLKASFVSPYTQILTGIDNGTLVGATDFLSPLVVEEDLERYTRARKVCLLGEDILVRYRILHPSGMEMWLESRMVPIFDEFGEVESLLIVTIDVTETLSYQAQIEQQNRDLGDFTYMVSHDLKAPIFTIKGMVSALTEDYGQVIGEGGHELCKFINDAANRLESLVSSIIEYASISTKELTKTEIDIKEIIANVEIDFSDKIKTSNATINILGDLPKIYAEQVRIYQVFSNLIGNAIKYADPKRAPVLNVRAKRFNNVLALIEVHDNGRGIPENRIADIFRPYNRIHHEGTEGSGIGLACVKKIVERLGGSVSVASTVGVGSTFTVLLPLAPDQPRQIPESYARLFEN